MVTLLWFLSDVIFRRKSLRYVRLRLSSVTLSHHTHRFELFGNIFVPSNSLGTTTVCIKMLEKIEGVLSDVTL